MVVASTRSPEPVDAYGVSRKLRDMRGYNLFVIGPNERVVSRREVESEFQEDAVRVANELLVAGSSYPAVEIWQGARRVARVERYAAGYRV
jgi:hypothetical protein